MTDSATGPLRVGFIGLGAIGLGVSRLIRRDASGCIEIVAALVRDPGREREAGSPATVGTLDELLALKPDVVVEAGGHTALRTHGPAVLRAGFDLITVSVGALADPQTEAGLRAAAAEGGVQVRVAAGAIGALDAVGAAARMGLDRVIHTTRKPARTLIDPAEAARLEEPLEIYRGTVREGALKFPESINVAAAVALAGIGFDRTEVRVVADPKLTRNTHEVLAEGPWGMFRFEVSAQPTPENPRTGQLVPGSVYNALLNRRAAIVLG